MNSQLDHTICGLDEAGRGALAGPLVLAAVVFPYDFTFEEVAEDTIVRDSKLLTAKQRFAVYDIIELYGLQIEVEVISVNDINTYGINWANTVGFSRLINRIQSSKYIVDGRWEIPDLNKKKDDVECIINADEFIPSTLAAGIVAKIKRDEILMNLHSLYPVYGWDTNTGHGTKKHLKGIIEHGRCEYHRTKFVDTAIKKIKENGTIL
jgi:ribonuclease HII